MEDNGKIGLLVERKCEGRSPLHTLNEGSWKSNVTDLRNLDNIKEQKNIKEQMFLFFRCIETGFLLCVAKKGQNRGGDGDYAYIHIPSNIDISGKEIEEYVEIVKECVKDDCYNKCSEIFAKEYNLISAERHIHKSSEKGCAFIYYGEGEEYNLHELLGKLNQEVYGKYKYVFFLDKKSGIECEGEEIKSDNIIEEIKVKAPAAQQGFSPFISGEKFDKDRYFYKGDQVKVEWRKDGYETIQREFCVGKDEFNLEFKENEVKKEFSYNFFIIKNKEKESIKSYSLKVNEKSLNKGETVAIEENNLSKVKVSVEAKGYKKGSFECSLYSNKESEIIILEDEIVEYTLDIPLDNCSLEEKKVIIKRPAAEKFKNPDLQGYSASKNGKQIEYKYNPPSLFNKKFWIICSIVSMLLLGTGVCAGWYVCNELQKQEFGEKNRKHEDKIKELEDKIEEREDKIKELEKKVKELEKKNKEQGNKLKKQEEKKDKKGAAEKTVGKGGASDNKKEPNIPQNAF